MQNNIKNNREQYLYHNTELLLKKYRDVVWSVEVSMAWTNMNFEAEFGTKIDEFIEMSYCAGADLTGTDIEEQIRTTERNRKMLNIINSSLDILRKKHKNGEMYYQILYLTYISGETYENTEAILEELADLGFLMSMKTYFKKKKEAISLISNGLWGFTSKNSNDVCDMLIEHTEKTVTESTVKLH